MHNVASATLNTIILPESAAVTTFAAPATRNFTPALLPPLNVVRPLNVLVPATV